MSVIVWDGNILAADCQMVNGNLRSMTSKIRPLHDEHNTVLAWVGSQEGGLSLAAWYEAGHRAADWPTSQLDKEDWTRLVVATLKGTWFYEHLPIAQPVRGKHAAWGSGRDFAMAALMLGANAVKAVEVTNQLCIDCGFGVEWFMVSIPKAQEPDDGAPI